jgi:hypothetical protein
MVFEFLPRPSELSNGVAARPRWRRLEANGEDPVAGQCMRGHVVCVVVVAKVDR